MRDNNNEHILSFGKKTLEYFNTLAGDLISFSLCVVKCSLSLPKHPKNILRDKDHYYARHLLEYISETIRYSEQYTIYVFFQQNHQLVVGRME